MEIRNTRVYGLEESILASSYPHKVELPTEHEFEYLASQIHIDPGQHLTRATKLGGVAQGSGHDCFLKGVIVQADFIAPRYWWNQAQRYHWFDIVSSQSQMHKVHELAKKQGIVLPDTECFEELLDALPQGFILGARVSTNYLQLKTMYNQRKNHKLTHWRIDFVKWCHRLPLFETIVLNK